MASSTSLRLYCHCRTAHHPADINPQNRVLKPPHHIISSFEFPYLFQHVNNRSFIPSLLFTFFICLRTELRTMKKIDKSRASIFFPLANC